jgi:chromosome partitioning protein
MASFELPRWVVSVINFKGGTGKSTVAIGIAECLCHIYGKRVVVIDCDFQCSASLALMGRRALGGLIERERTLDHHILKRFRSASTPALDAIAVKPERCVFEADGLIHLLPSNPSMPRIERQILAAVIEGSDIERAYVQASVEIAALVRGLLDDFDIVLIDCPPGLTLFSEAAILASDGIVVPTLPNDLSLAAVDHLKAEIARVRTDVGFADLLIGTVISKVRHRNATAHHVYQTQAIEKLLDRAAPSFRILRPYLPYCRELEAASWRDDDPDRLSFATVYGEAAERIRQLTADFVASCHRIDDARNVAARARALGYASAVPCALPHAAGGSQPGAPTILPQPPTKWALSERTKPTKRKSA